VEHQDVLRDSGGCRPTLDLFFYGHAPSTGAAPREFVSSQAEIFIGCSTKMDDTGAEGWTFIPRHDSMMSHPGFIFGRGSIGSGVQVSQLLQYGLAVTSLVIRDDGRHGGNSGLVSHSERATLRVGDVFLKIDTDQARIDVEVVVVREGCGTATRTHALQNERSKAVSVRSRSPDQPRLRSASYRPSGGDVELEDLGREP
jgi:hypothetical protein